MHSGIACWQSARPAIKRLQVQIPAEAAGEFSSPELILCADSYSVSIPSHYRLHLNMHTPLTPQIGVG